MKPVHGCEDLDPHKQVFQISDPGRALGLVWLPKPFDRLTFSFSMSTFLVTHLPSPLLRLLQPKCPWVICSNTPSSLTRFGFGVLRSWEIRPIRFFSFAISCCCSSFCSFPPFWINFVYSTAVSKVKFEYTHKPIRHKHMVTCLPCQVDFPVSDVS